MKGTKIEFLRLLRGYTQDYIATQTEIEITKYKRIEGDFTKATKSELAKIAEILGSSTDELTNPNPFILIQGDRIKENILFNASIAQQLISIISKKDQQLERLILLLEERYKTNA